MNMSNKLVLLLILLLFLLLSGLMLFDNSGHQPVVLGIVDPFFFLFHMQHFPLYSGRSKKTDSIIKSKFNFCIHFSKFCAFFF